ncbi:MAG: CinA family protein [Pseudomonadota bacterium]
MLDETLDSLHDFLLNNKLSIASAESCTSGMLANMLAKNSGSSAYYKGGIIAYCNDLKVDLLNVSKKTLHKYGAVSQETAIEMALGVQKICKSDIGISTTGIAGPSGATAEKPIGLVYIGFAFKNNNFTKKFNFIGDRQENKKSTCAAAIQIIYDTLVN